MPALPMTRAKATAALPLGGPRIAGISRGSVDSPKICGFIANVSGWSSGSPETPMSNADAAPPAERPIIELRHVDKWYGDFQVLKDVNLEVGKGERVVVCGPSGSGKSTMIRCINRLEEHQRGQ